MIEKKVTGLPVVDDKMKLVGLITEKDVLMLLYNFGDRPGRIEDFMTRDIVSFDQEEGLMDVCDCLLINHFRRVPIVAGPGKKLVGIISRTDIIRCIFQYQGFFRDTPFLTGQLADVKTKIQLLKQQLEDESSLQPAFSRKLEIFLSTSHCAHTPELMTGPAVAGLSCSPGQLKLK